MGQEQFHYIHIWSPERRIEEKTSIWRNERKAGGGTTINNKEYFILIISDIKDLLILSGKIGKDITSAGEVVIVLLSVSYTKNQLLIVHCITLMHIKGVFYIYCTIDPEEKSLMKHC